MPAMHQDFAVGSHQWHFASPCELTSQPTHQPQQCDNEIDVSSQSARYVQEDFGVCLLIGKRVCYEVATKETTNSQKYKRHLLLPQVVLLSTQPTLKVCITASRLYCIQQRTKADWQQVIGLLATQGLRKFFITLFNTAMVPVLDQQGESMKGAEIMQYSKPSVRL